MKKHICFIKFLAIFLAIVILTLLLSIVVCSFALHTSNYTVSLDCVTTPVHAVVISDFHGKEFGREACLSIYRMDGKIPITAWGKLYKAGLFDDIRYPVGKIHEDDATTPKLLYKSKNVVQIKQKLYLYRIMREGSIMNQPFSVKRFDSMDAVDSCIRFFEQKSDYDLVKISKQAKRVMQSKMIIQANKNNAKNEIPREYRMKKLRALINLHRYVSQSLFEWYLSLAYPGLVKPYSYAEKIINTLREGKKT